MDTLKVAAGVDLGGTAVNYTLITGEGKFLIEGLCEHPARAKEGPEICLQQIVDGLEIAVAQAGLTLADVATVGLDTPGPASATGVLSAEGSTNFAHKAWSGFDIRGVLEQRIHKPVTYLNDGNAAALWGHFAMFANRKQPATSISAIIGTGLGGGVVVDDHVVKGRLGYAGELGHLLLPWHDVAGMDGIVPMCNCGRRGDLESMCSLTAIGKNYLPWFLKKYPGHELASDPDIGHAAKRVRGLAEKGDPMCREIFALQARALGLFFDQMINAFDPDALIVGGGAIETGAEFQQWFLGEVRGAMPHPWPEQADIPICIMPNGDTAGARGAAIDALRHAREIGWMGEGQSA